MKKGEKNEKKKNIKKKNGGLLEVNSLSNIK
jgi:hypothetical protein